MAEAIKVSDYVRAFDFDSRDLEGERACYVEGDVVALVKREGCMFYAISVDREVWAGVEEASPRALVYSPVNGTPTTMGRVTDYVTKID